MTALLSHDLARESAREELDLSVTKAVRRSLPAAASAAASLAMIGAAAVPPALAARSAADGLHVTGQVQIASGLTFAGPVTEAPGGALYFGRGRSVYVVNGSSPPRLLRTGGGRVVGLGASSGELFVEVGRIVTEYRRSDDSAGRSWHLSSPQPVKQAGLFPVGRTVWSWTDGASDTGGEGTGAEPATISRFRISSATVHKVTGNGAQGMLAADAAGAYFLSFSGRLEHVSPAGRVRSVKADVSPVSLTLAGGRVEILADHFIRRESTLRVRVDAYQASNLRTSFSRDVPLGDFALAETGAGLLALTCPTASCSTERVVRLDPFNGKTVSSLVLPFGTEIVPGPAADVITRVKVGANYHYIKKQLAP
jgi:hypothetical protein